MLLHHKGFRRALLGASALAGAVSMAAASPALSQAREVQFDLAPQPLSSALREYGFTADQQLIFAESEVRAYTAPALRGAYTPDEGLSLLLAGTGLIAERTPSGIVRIVSAQGPQGGSAGTDADAAVEALVVTAQKKEEQIQDVPIAISAFTQKSLDAQKLEGGFDLLKAIPNVSFSKSNFSGYNFSIRGIGTKAVSATTDPGVAVAFNNSTLIVNRLFEQEYFDVERVEVLRGPQGTLFGRNATGGVINVISARPRLMEFEGDLKVETGNYNAQRVRGMVNVPIGDTLAIRAAGAMTKRDGYGYNQADGSDVDDRNLWSARVTVGWEPVEAIRVNALWERFEEDDQRVRTSKQLCHYDPGPNNYPNFDWDDVPDSPAKVIGRANTSQGCLPGSLYADGAFGTPNGASLPFVSGLYLGSAFGSIGSIISGNVFPGLGGNPYFAAPLNPDPLPAPCERATLENFLSPLNVCQPDPYGGQTQSRDLRTIHSLIEPVYRAKADLFELSIDLDLTDSLTFTSQTVYSQDEYYASQDYNRFTTLPIFNDSSIGCDVLVTFGFNAGPDCTVPGQLYADGFYNVTPGGVFTDPQLGPSRTLVGQDLSQAKSEQFNQEFRIASNFDADMNFSLGANFTRFETMNDYYVFLNATTLLTNFFPFNVHTTANVQSCSQAGSTQNPWECVYVDPNPLEEINGEGHNYFRSANPYELTSSAIFGELYWQATDTVKVTLGGRMSWDMKKFTPIPSQLLLMDYRHSVLPGVGPEGCTSGFCMYYGTGVNGRGSPPNPDIVQEWREPTGRLIVDWKPDLAFTDETMVYASLAHGYKGGGANPPGIAPPAGIFNAANSGAVAPRTFEPEYIDALELGAKNTLLDGALILNGSAFYYDYKGYQVSKIVDRSAVNENFDAKVWGAEIEWIYSPMRSLRFNGTFGALRTEIADGAQSIDLMDRTQEYTTGMEQTFGDYTGWVLIKPWITSASNCIAPKELVDLMLNSDESGFQNGFSIVTGSANLTFLCPGGNLLTNNLHSGTFRLPGGIAYNPAIEAPNGGAGFAADVSGHELPNAPHWTASLGGQYRFALPGGWDGTIRGDFYWQSQSYARVYNTQYDKLRAWTNANISLWFEQPDWGVTAEVYVKNAFDETPITDAFLNSDDSGLTTNVFTLDPRLVGVSVRKSF